MKRSKPEFIDVKADDLEPFLQRVKAALNETDFKTLNALVESYVYIIQLLQVGRTTANRLRKMLFGSGSEKTSNVLDTAGDDAEARGGQEDAAAKQDSEKAQESETPKRKGHGRNGANAYAGAEKIEVPHESLKPGESCPDCENGTVYEVTKPGVLVRIVGQAPVQATVYELQKLRCNLCGNVFTARAPKVAGSEKYDATAASMIALLKYGSGLPFNRLEGLQGNLGIPLPSSTQWDIVSDTAKLIKPVYDELIRQAAQGEVLYNDDTTMKILDLMGKRAKAQALAESEDAPECAKGARERTGIFTSGIVSTSEGRTIALFFTGRRHAGENLTDVLDHRASALPPPIQMCDALSRNMPKELATILANCLAHGRRQFVDVVENFPEACRHVLEILCEIYRNDAITREQGLSPQDRLEFHQAESRPLMDGLKDWMTKQLEDRLVEPNSGLGEAIAYMLKHWEKLTLFLRTPGAPLDNNLCERILKRAILHRKNAMFYKSVHGAHVGDVFMSLIHTCQLGGVNPFDYLTELGNHAAELSRNPQDWMPWNYPHAAAARR